MQGKKIYQEKLFTNFQLSEFIPEDNFYRRLKNALDLSYLPSITKQYYGDCGQKSIDPIVFVKICLVGYLENVISDRRLMNHCNMRLDVRYFLGYDLDQTLPWHSTLSRTRALYPKEVFERVFGDVFTQCVIKGMVAGHTQSLDAAPVKANASMDSLGLKVPAEDLEAHLDRYRYKSTPDRKAKNDKASKEQKTIKASKRELTENQNRQKRYGKTADQRPGMSSKGAKYTSNKTHYSPVDPDAKISTKPGKARKLNYAAQMSVDSSNHVITDIFADSADKKDNQSLPKAIERVEKRLKQNGLQIENLLADTGYSSGENYALLEQKSISSYIPPHGTYSSTKKGLTYFKEGNYYQCSKGKRLVFKGTKINSKGIKHNKYATSKFDCLACPLALSCKGKSNEKVVSDTFYKPEYERNIKRIKSKTGKALKRKRHATVEPVFGSLTQFFGLSKLYTRGLDKAHKCMLMAAAAYNLKKLMKFDTKTLKTTINSIEKAKPLSKKLGALLFEEIKLQISGFKALFIFHKTTFCK